MSSSMTDNGHDTWAALAVGHALNALEPEDEESFRNHLPGCDACAGVVAETQVVMGDLAYAVEPVDPPPSLRTAIRASIADSERRPVETRVRPATVSRQRPALRLTARPWMAVAAGLALLMSLSVWNVVLQSQNRSQERRLEQAALITGCLHEVGCRTVQLRTPNDDSPRATALVRARDVQLVVTDLPRNDTDAEVYVLWQRVNQTKFTALDTFDITRPGVTVIRAHSLASAVNRLGVIAVSREPGRRAPAAPSEVVALGTIGA
ncbi:MAG: hypothetical protein ACR2JO_05080 [Mycobacteriales bacterium]